MRQVEQIAPVACRELPRDCRQRSRAVDWLVAGEHAAAQKVVGVPVDRILEISICEAVAYARRESVHQSVDFAHLDDTLDFAARDEPQRHRVDRAEQTITSDRKREKPAMFAAAAVDKVAPRIDEPK